MNRRKFLSISTSGMVVLSSNSLSASIFDDRDYEKDALLLTDSKQYIKKDIIYKNEKFKTLFNVFHKIKKVQRIVGYGNFNIISFDQLLKITKRYSRVEEFNNNELYFIEEIFYKNASDYGFFGSKVLNNLTYSILKKKIKKIPYTGHYLYDGQSIKLYYKIKKDIGNSMILTSGVRGVVKQMYLFFNKAIKTRGNLSVASRSLAPPGYSFHGIGDFDIGKVGYGYRNFTTDFVKTDEFKKLIDLGYINIRYPKGNPFGVRFEPWHIKV